MQPLLPGYLAFLSGATGEIQNRSGRGRAVLGAVAFVVGFALVFVSFGALFGGLGSTLRTHQRTLEEVFGVVTVMLGLFFAGWWPSSWLQRERRVHRLPQATIVGAALLGFTFALGWTPCIGPILAAVLTLAATQETVMRGVGLLAVSSEGPALPFFLPALGISRFLGFFRRFRRHLYAVEVFSGVLLLVVGGLIFLNRLTWLSGKLSFLNTFSR